MKRWISYVQLDDEITDIKTVDTFEEAIEIARQKANGNLLMCYSARPEGSEPPRKKDELHAWKRYPTFS